jgi:hypothetical protein
MFSFGFVNVVSLIFGGWLLFALNLGAMWAGRDTTGYLFTCLKIYGTYALLATLTSWLIMKERSWRKALFVAFFPVIFAIIILLIINIELFIVKIFH